MSVTPLYIEIMNHFYCRASRFERDEAPACRSAISSLVAAGMIEPYPNDGDDRQFIATEKGRAWIDFLCEVPFPVTKWVLPQEISK